jgi:hypothetical protein
MISEQVGQGNEELAFHFDTEFNRAMLFGRSAAIALIGIWVLAGSRRKAGPVIVGLGILAGAIVFFASDYPKLTGYRVEVLAQGLRLDIPPDEEKFFPWASIDEMYIEGVGPAETRRGDAFAQMLELPDWQSMEITATGGVHRVDLAALSMEQRQTLWKAVARYGGLVEIE